MPCVLTKSSLQGHWQCPSLLWVSHFFQSYLKPRYVFSFFHVSSHFISFSLSHFTLFTNNFCHFDYHIIPDFSNFLLEELKRLYTPIIPCYLKQSALANKREQDDHIMWSYKLPIELSLFVGYFLARVGWHEVAALVTALVLTVEYHYAVSRLPKVYNSVVQLSVRFWFILFLPYDLVYLYIRDCLYHSCCW